MGPLAQRELASRRRCSRRHRIEGCVKSFGPSAYRMHASVRSHVGYRHGRGWLSTAFPTDSGPSSWEPDGSTPNGCHVFVDNQRYPRRVTTGRAVSRESGADSQPQSSARPWQRKSKKMPTDCCVTVPPEGSPSSITRRHTSPCPLMSNSPRKFLQDRCPAGLFAALLASSGL